MVNLRYRDNKVLYTSLINISLPIALQWFITSSLNLVDNLMIGQLGEAEFSAVGMANQLFFIYTSLFFGFTSGAGAFVAQFWGNRDLSNIKKVLGFSLIFTFIAGLIFFIASFIFPENVMRIFSKDAVVIEHGIKYLTIVSFTFLLMAITIPHASVLKITEQAKLPMKVSAAAFIINTALNYALIFGKFGFEPMGIQGAAYATIIARLCEMLLMLYFVYVKNNIVRGTFSELFSFNSHFAKRILTTAFPVVVNEAFWGLGMTTYGIIYGHMGTTEYAAIQVSNTIYTLFIMAIFSIGDATLILIGKELGQNNEKQAYANAIKLLSISVILGLLSGIVLIILAPVIVRLFNFTNSGKQFAAVILTIYGSVMWLKIFNGINIVGVFRGGGDTKFAMFTEVFTVWFVGIPLVLTGGLLLELPLFIIVLMAQFEEVAKAIICFTRLKSKKWINNIIHDM
ncbi:MAG: MATE family efflux transporter [Clostridiales bacterium]|nr:MATE family efflux transporter [Clostridiales bacterium]